MDTIFVFVKSNADLIVVHQNLFLFVELMYCLCRLDICRETTDFLKDSCLKICHQFAERVLLFGCSGYFSVEKIGSASKQFRLNKIKYVTSLENITSTK